MKLNVVVKLKILPKDAQTDLEEIKEKLSGIVSSYGKIHKTEIKPIAFGLNSLEVTLLLNDKKGGMDEIEQEISGLDLVGEVTVTDATLI